MAKPGVDPQKRYRHLKNKVNWAVCDHCGWNWPEDLLNFRDGLKVCPNHTDYLESSNQRSIRIDRESARLARKREPQPKWPHVPEMRGVSGVTAISPNPLSLTSGGFSGALLLRGRNLSFADTIAFSNGNVTLSGARVFTFIDSETCGNTETLTISAAPGTQPGFYDLIYDGNTFKGVIKVR